MSIDPQTILPPAASTANQARGPRPMLDRGHRAVSSLRVWQLRPEALISHSPVASARRQRFARIVGNMYLLAIMALVLVPYAVGLFTIAYVIKRALGIDFFPDFHLTDLLK